MFYVIRDLCCLSCQEQKSIRLELEAKPGAQRRRTFSLWISHVRFESFLTHSTWQCEHQRRLHCELEPRNPAFSWGKWTVKDILSHWQRLWRFNQKMSTVCVENSDDAKWMYITSLQYLVCSDINNAICQVKNFIMLHRIITNTKECIK